MEKEYKRFTNRILRLQRRADAILEDQNLPTWKLIYYMEGLVSDTWQFWNVFCRNLLILSCQGCTGRSGHFYPVRSISDNSINHIALEYTHYKNGNTSPLLKCNKILHPHNFPTWGATRYILNVINGLSTSNKNVLMTAFSLPLNGIEELQNLRNTLFHMEEQKIKDLYKYYYTNYNIKVNHPALIIFEIKNNTLIFFSWLDDMKHIALNATI